MARTVAADLTVTLNVSDTDTSNTAAATGDVFTFQETAQLYYGASPNPVVSREWSGSYTLSATPTTLDLTSLTGLRGATETFATVRLLLIRNTSTMTGYGITVGNGSSPFTPGFSSGTTTWAVPARSRWLAEYGDTAAGWTVDSSHKTVKLDPGSNVVTCTVFIVGT